MPTSEISIFNLALSHCKSTKFIESPDQAGIETDLFRVHYEATRDVVLGLADWPFARKRANLVKTGSPPAEWGFSYAIPSDCITVQAIGDGKRARTIDDRIKYWIEGRLLYMNVDTATVQIPAQLIYTSRVTNPAAFPSDFVRALSWAIAAEIARPLHVDVTEAVEILRHSDRLIGEAIAANYNESKGDVPAPSDLWTSRLG